MAGLPSQRQTVARAECKADDRQHATQVGEEEYYHFPGGSAVRLTSNLKADATLFARYAARSVLINH
jgi:hypothetical protein